MAEESRQVEKEVAEAYAKEAGLLFFETSAKTGENIVELFTAIAKKLPVESVLSGGRGTGGGATGTRNQRGIDLKGPASGANACQC